MHRIVRFLRYLWCIMKDIFMIISLFFDILGVFVTYFTNYKVPKHIYIIILAVGFIISNYRIYIKNSPDINMSASLFSKRPFKELSSGESYINLMVFFNLYINNNGNNVGIIEDFNVELLRFSDVKDKYLLEKVGIKFREFFISDEEIFVPLEYMKSEVETEFPIILDSKKTIKKILILYIEISGSDADDYLKTIEWMKDMEFALKLKVINDNIEKNITYKLTISKNDIRKFALKHS